MPRRRVPCWIAPGERLGASVVQSRSITALTDAEAFSGSEIAALFEPLLSYDDVFVAVSGGADSTALMHLLARWRTALAAPRERQPPKIVVLSVDHGLRPEAAGEARSVVFEATRLGFAAEVLTWSGELPESGIQAAARAIRYRLLSERVRQAGGQAVVMTAHHRDDLAETVLMRLARGGGVDGLAAMSTFADVHGVSVFRPFLDVAKSRLVASLTAGGATWIEDPSNANPEFERVRLRHAQEARVTLGLTDAALSLTSSRMTRARRALESWVDRLLAPELSNPLLNRTGIFVWRWRPGELEDEIGVRLLQRILPGVAGREQPVRLLRVERLYEAMQHEDFKGATLGNCVIRWCGHSGSIVIFREAHRRALPAESGSLTEPLIWDNRFEIRLRGEPRGAVRVRAFRREDLGDGDEKPLLPGPIEALEATPVLEDEMGTLSIPALDVHRRAGQTELEPANDRLGGYVCRFRTDLFRVGNRRGAK